MWSRSMGGVAVACAVECFVVAGCSGRVAVDATPSGVEPVDGGGTANGFKDASHPTSPVDGATPSDGPVSPERDAYGLRDARGGGVDLPGVCFASPPDVCRWGEVAARDPSLGWTVQDAMPLVGGQGLALQIAHALDGQAGHRTRVVEMDRGGSCVRAVSGEFVITSPQWNLARAATGGGTTAAVVRCAHKFACGTVLHAGGSLVADLETDPGQPDGYGIFTHEVTVGGDGTILAVTGPAESRNSTPFTADRLVVRRFPPGESGTSVVTWDFHEVLGGIAPAPDGGAILLLHRASDASAGASLVRRIDPGGVTYWQWDPGFRVDHLAAIADVVVAAGVPTPGAGSSVVALDVQTGAMRWQASAVQPGALPLGVGIGTQGSVRLLTTAAVSWGVLVSLGRGDGVVAFESAVDAPLLPTPAVGTPTRFGVANDGTAIITLSESVAACADAP